MTIIYAEDFEVEIIRSSRRRTLSLQIKDGKAIIRMPTLTPTKFAVNFVHQKTDWIRQKLTESRPVLERQLVSGETLLYFGQTLTLIICPEQTQRSVITSGSTITLNHRGKSYSAEMRHRQLLDWYKQQAQAYLQARVRLLADVTRLKPTHLTTKNYTARWGSCKLDGSIQLNWKLIMAPPAVIDYVIIHELCHLEQHNHSPAFWQLVEQFDRDYKQHRFWLKQHGSQLTI